MLCEQHQDHLMDNWPMPGTDDDKNTPFSSRQVGEAEQQTYLSVRIAADLLAYRMHALSE